MTLDTVGQFLQMYWGLLGFCGVIIWRLITMHFDLKNIKDEMVAHKEKNMRDIEEATTKIETVEKNLTALINRNKEVNEIFINSVQNKLEHIGNSIVKMDTTIAFYMTNKNGKADA